MPGSTTITAASGRISGSTTLTVNQPSLVSIVVSPSSVSLQQGSTQQFSAAGTYSDNTTKDVTALASWSSLSTSIATVNSAGLAMALSSGTTTIQASSGAISGSASLSVSGGFTPTGSLGTARGYHTATLLNNGTVLIAGGIGLGGIQLAGAEIYDPASGTFSATGSMTAARYYHVATPLSDGKVLITGGAGPGGVYQTAELFDPATGIFVKTLGNMVNVHYYHQATLLANGKVLISGGYGSAARATAELYDPATQTFTATGSMNAARALHSATLLSDGTVLVAGGENSGGSLSSAEVYILRSERSRPSASCPPLTPPPLPSG